MPDLQTWNARTVQGPGVEETQPTNSRPDSSLLKLWQVVGALARHAEASMGDVAVFCAITDRMGKKGEAWPGLGLIASDTGLHRSTVVRCVDRLTRLGFLVRKSGGKGRSNRYLLGSSADAPSRTDAPSRMDAPQVVAPTRLQVVAPTRPESTKGNLPNEPTKRTRTKRVPVSLPDWLPDETWKAWKRHRGAKLTQEAGRRFIAKLETLHGEGQDVVELVERAIERGWASVYPDDKRTAPGKVERDERPSEEIDAENAAELARFGIGGVS